jgi:MFS family permease
MVKNAFARPFWLLCSSSLISGLGDGVRFVALPLLAASLTRDPVLISLVTVAGQLPWIVVGPITGVLTDRLDRRRLIWQVALFQAAAMAAFTGLVLTDQVGLPWLLVAAFVLGSAETLSMNVSAAIVPELVGKERLAAANSLVQGAQFVASDVVGLGVGAVLFTLAPALPFTVDTISFVVAALLVMGIRPLVRERVAVRLTVRSVGVDIAEGMRWLLRHPLLRTLCVLVAVSNFAVIGAMSIAVLYALQVLHVSQNLYGLLLVIIAVGGLVGLTTASVLGDRFGVGRILQVTYLLSPVPFVITALTSQPLVAALSFFFVGASISMGNVLSISLRQKLIPSELFGRVNGSFRLLALGLGPLGGGFAGVLAHVFGLRAPFFFGAAVFMVTAVMALSMLSNRSIAEAEQLAAEYSEPESA